MTNATSTPTVALRNRAEKAEHTISVIENEIAHITSYLQSDKFAGAGNDHVNVNDVLARLQELVATIADEECGAFGMSCPLSKGSHIASGACARMLPAA